jgi:hypothetical protein
VGNKTGFPNFYSEENLDYF